MATCLEMPVDEPDIAPTIDAIRSFFTLESAVWADPEKQMAVAERFAGLATAADAEDPYAYYAKARLAYLRSNCPAGIFHGDRAIAANPYDSMIVTVLAGLTTPCSRSRAAALLDRAYRIRNDNDVSMRNSLIFATIAQGQERRLAELGFLLRPPPGPQLRGYLMSEALISASQGRRAEATNAWKELRQLSPTNSLSDNDMLRTIIVSEPLRRQVLLFLRKHEVIQS